MLQPLESLGRRVFAVALAEAGIAELAQVVFGRLLVRAVETTGKQRRPRPRLS